MREARGRLSGLVCPIGGPNHGKLIMTATGFYCSHQEHDGRPVRSRHGEAPPTRKFFTYEELQNA